MSNSRRVLVAVLWSVATVLPLAAVTAQSAMSVSPFLSLIPSVGANPLAGMALTFGGTTGLAFRGSADLAIANANSATAGAVGYRPWGADADAMLFLGGLGGGATVFSHALSPYLFTGLGLTGGDSSGANVMHNGWSYGAGATIPLGLDADVFGEARWRMPEYVLPTAHLAPSSTSEFRFGLSFHIGGSSNTNRGRGPRYDDEAPRAPAAAPVTVIYPPSPPAPVVIMPSQAPAAYPSMGYPPVGYPPVVEAPIVIGPVFDRPVIERPVIVAPVIERPVIERPMGRGRRPLVVRPGVSQPIVVDPRQRGIRQPPAAAAAVARGGAAPQRYIVPNAKPVANSSRQAAARREDVRRPD